MKVLFQPRMKGLATNFGSRSIATTTVVGSLLSYVETTPFNKHCPGASGEGFRF